MPMHVVSYLVVQVSPERMEKVSQLLLLLALATGGAVADCPAGQVTFAKKIHRCLSNYLAKCNSRRLRTILLEFANARVRYGMSSKITNKNYK